MRLETALRSGDPDEVASVVAMNDGDELDPVFVADVARLDIDIDPTDAATDGDGETIVHGTGGGEPWLLFLRFDDRLGWQLVSTAPQS